MKRKKQRKLIWVEDKEPESKEVNYKVPEMLNFHIILW